MWGFDRDRASGEFIGRLAGSHILQTFCRNFLGTPLRDLHHGHVFEVAHASLTRAVSAPACCRFSGKLFRTGGKLVAGERLLLPIGADPMRPDGVLGASCYGSYTPSRPPAPIEPLRGRPDWCRWPSPGASSPSIPDIHLPAWRPPAGIAPTVWAQRTASP
jgi:hypothetical protein